MADLPLALLIRVDIDLPKRYSSDRYGHVYAELVAIRPERTDYPIDHVYSHESPLAGFGASCQFHHDPEHAYSTSGSYAWRHGFQTSTYPPLHDLERYVKVMRKLEKAMERLNAQYGPPKSFGQYIAWLAKCLKIDTFCRFRDGHFQQTTTPGDVIYWIDHPIAVFHAEQAEQCQQSSVS